MSLLIEDDELLKTYKKSGIKSGKLINKVYDNEPVYNEKYKRNKIKSHDDKINTGFKGNNIPEEGSHCICLSVR